MGGAIIGAIAALLASKQYEKYSHARRLQEQKKRFEYLASKDADIYDWLSYTLNGMDIGKEDGSKMNLQYVEDNEFYFKWIEATGDEGEGRIYLDNDYFGKMSYGYKRRFFCGFKDVFIQHDPDAASGELKDYIYTVGDRLRGLGDFVIVRSQKLRKK